MMDDTERLESELRRRGKTFAVVELLLGLAAFGLAGAMWTGVFEWQALSGRGIWFAYGGVLLGVIFVIGGVRGLLRS